jgi:hypothetical protein
LRIKLLYTGDDDGGDDIGDDDNISWRLPPVFCRLKNIYLFVCCLKLFLVELRLTDLTVDFIDDFNITVYNLNF